MHQVADLFDFATCQAKWTKVPENKVVVCARGLEFIVLCDELGAEDAGVGDDLLGIFLEAGGGDLLQGGCDRCNRLEKS